MGSYTLDDFREGLRRSGLVRGSVVFCHANIGYFGVPDPRPASSAELCDSLLGCVFDVIGPEGTFVVPTFTYSFPQGRVFDPSTSTSGCGALAEHLRDLPGAVRSQDPCFSVAAMGAKAAILAGSASENSFDERSFFHRFLEADGIVCNWNLDAGSTFIHYVERRLRVPYRFDKTFRGEIMAGGETVHATSTIWVRYLSSDLTTASFEEFDRLARARGFFRTVPVGRGSIGTISARDSFSLVEETLRTRPWFLTRAEAAGEIPELIPES